MGFDALKYTILAYAFFRVYFKPQVYLNKGLFIQNTLSTWKWILHAMFWYYVFFFLHIPFHEHQWFEGPQ